MCLLLLSLNSKKIKKYKNNYLQVVYLNDESCLLPLVLSNAWYPKIEPLKSVKNMVELLSIKNCT